MLSLGPRSTERPADSGATLVAGLDGRGPARLDGGGLVSPGFDQTGPSLPFSLDWWIGADDRWYLPAREPAVRQRRVGHGPIIETSLRVPSGDVIHTAYPVVLAGRTVTVIDILNDSPVPVALALAVRPYGTSRTATETPAGSAPRLELTEPGVISVDGIVAVGLPRMPNEAGASADDDLLDHVQAGKDLSWDGPVAGVNANAVCLYPLPHRTALRFIVESGDVLSGRMVLAPGADIASLSAESLPDSASAAKGWTAVVDGASRYEFPDSGITGLAGAARARVLLAAADLGPRIVEQQPGAGLVLQGLAVGGHRFDCRAALETFAPSFATELTSSPVAAAEVIAGIGLAAELVADAEIGGALLEPTAQLTHLVEQSASSGGLLSRFRPGGRRSDTDDELTKAVAVAKTGLARLVSATGQHHAAAELRQQAASAETSDLDRLTVMAEQAAPARRWNGPANQPDSPEAAARFWLAARELLLIERHDDDGRAVIELLPQFPTAWRGGTVEVHEAPIVGYTVSFAIRWHGYRPALLWDVSGADGLTETAAAQFPRITCPGLDPDWEAEEPKGEALLAGAAEELPAAPAPGDSFL